MGDIRRVVPGWPGPGTVPQSEPRTVQVVDRTNESVERRLHFSPGYGNVGWANRASGDGSGLGGRVGFHHKTLASFLGAVVDSGLKIRTMEEFAGGDNSSPPGDPDMKEHGSSRESGAVMENDHRVTHSPAWLPRGRI